MTQQGTARIDHVALPPGAAIDRYVVREVLGQGGFGITYRAHDTRLHREVAIKEYLPAALAVRPDGASVLPRSTEAAADFGWGRERFLEEARRLAGLHEAPAIVEVFDFLEANGTAYMVMERLPGLTLEERVRRDGPLPAATVEKMLGPLLDGLEAVHAAGFLHRDIKPANIVLGEDGGATLIDFGASRAAMAGRTRTMTAIFTPGFAAPEQFSATKQGPWTDVYGLAATLVFALTGAAPPSAVDRLMEETWQPLALRPPTGGKPPAGGSPALLAGIDAALALPVEQRPPDIAAWRALLPGHAAGDAPTVVMTPKPAGALPTAAPVPSPTPPTPPSPPTALAVAPPGRVGRLGWIALGVVGALALAGAGIGVWSHLAPPKAPAARPQAEAPAPPSPSTVPSTAPAAAPNRSAAPPVRSAPRAAATSFVGALSGSATGGGAPSLAPVTVEVRAGAGTLNGRIVHTACGSMPVILAVGGDGSVSGSLRLWEASGCATSPARASGRLDGRGLALDLRGVDVAYRGTLSPRQEPPPKEERAPDSPAPPSSRSIP